MQGTSILDVTLLEADSRVGGKIRTTTSAGYVIENGPDSFLARGGDMCNLVHAVGLDDQLVSARSHRVYVFDNGRLCPFPANTVLGVTGTLGSLLRTRLVSPRGKARALWDVVRADTTIEGDESIGTFLRRRLGNEWVDRLVAPLVAGIHGESIDCLSVRATSPNFLALKGNHRSVILGARRGREAARRPAGVDSWH